MVDPMTRNLIHNMVFFVVQNIVNGSLWNGHWNILNNIETVSSSSNKSFDIYCCSNDFVKCFCWDRFKKWLKELLLIWRKYLAVVDVWVDNLNQGDQCIQCSGPYLKDTRTCSYFLLWSLESRDSCVSSPVYSIFRSRAARKILIMIFFQIRFIFI